MEAPVLAPEARGDSDVLELSGLAGVPAGCLAELLGVVVGAVALFPVGAGSGTLELAAALLGVGRDFSVALLEDGAGTGVEETS